MIAKFIVKSSSHFAIKIILAERSRLRSSQPCKAAKRWAIYLKDQSTTKHIQNKFTNEISNINFAFNV